MKRLELSQISLKSWNPRNRWSQPGLECVYCIARLMGVEQEISADCNFNGLMALAFIRVPIIRDQSYRVIVLDHPEKFMLIWGSIWAIDRNSKYSENFMARENFLFCQQCLGDAASKDRTSLFDEAKRRHPYDLLT